ncbi:class I SAM-dependent DNA methyltransferase [Entomospira culicis]|uniref:site-specific DNA-methyltransferase (adenine-specific) n=1 Tax=Entomospira culicis TaxID=2719989 RepID=A0A968GIG5_9SPIO|nr:DNA methyltransferase [Entomospira culicis]NIZ19526.1 N-6 DNA methylase [Entomospira culicis]NIZ69569.1 N-6 DNA methylase [Entomospira culicis]WDI36680.1 N-6 DNA methylase [Entomospira culicis]WDI38309.1 N-6 DNA methylase [Entomospira culicis]
MYLSIDEIADRARSFVYDWQDYEGKEIAEAQTFWNDLFMVYGRHRLKLASFEASIKKMTGSSGRIDVFWPGQLLVEQKAPHVTLDDTVMQQAVGYVEVLPEAEKPKFVVLCNFHQFKLLERASGEITEFSLADFAKHYYQAFMFIAGYSEFITYQEEEISLQAAELLAKLYTAIEDGDNQPSLELNFFMVQLLYCFFADHTSLFTDSKSARPFQHYLEKHSNPDGRDLHNHIREIFEVLNTPKEERDARLPDDLKSFPYVNGDLFADTSYRLYSNATIRERLLEVANFNWADISPAIFGTLFQTITDPKTRQIRGEHYTSETNILKAINPLFLDDLEQEYELCKENLADLTQFIEKLASITVLDPACGSGNFLVVAYRELRELELKALKHLHKDKRERHMIQEAMHAQIKVNVHQFYGIEIEALPSKIAQLALWLTDHQMNMQVVSTFGFNYTRLPLTASATIWNKNALTCDWNELINAKKLNYIVGNPPFYGARKQTKEQRTEMKRLFREVKGASQLDYVACWYQKSVEMMQLNDKIKGALVSTNSITQGAQVFPLWHRLMREENLHIHFAHRTFKWFNEAKDKAQIHCVVIGFARFPIEKKRLWDYDIITNKEGERVEQVSERKSALAINPYLVFDDEMIIVQELKTPLDPTSPKMAFGSMPNDGGHLLFSAEEKQAFLTLEPKAEPFFRRVMGSDEFLNSKERYCLWLLDANPLELAKMPHVMARVNAVREYRLNSKREATRKLADTAHLFGEIRQPSAKYIIIPSVSSEHRVYSPMGYLDKNTIMTNSAFSLENVTPYLFGVLSSRMHQVWLASVGGRMKSDYRYSVGLVYNTFPFPSKPTPAQQAKVAGLAQQMLEVRNKYLSQGATLANLYDKSKFYLYQDLVKVHRELDKAVERCYRKEPFDASLSNMDRITFLLSQYKLYTDTLFHPADDNEKPIN